MVRMTWGGWVGAALISLGVVPLGCWTSWFYTRAWCPVDIPISLAPGSTFSTKEFLVNLNARYEIGVDSNRQIPYESLECPLGRDTCREQVGLKVHWVLSGDGTPVQGTDETVGYSSWGPLSGPSWSIGEFPAQKGKRYQLRGNVIAAGEKVSAPHARLRVEVFDTSYESSLIVNGLLRFVSIVLVLSGGGVLLVSLLRQRRKAAIAPG